VIGPTADRPTDPQPPHDARPPRKGPSRLEADVAALVALALAAVAAIMLIAGHHPWDGKVIAVFSQTHGLHRGDVMSIGPMIVGVGLAWWCHRQGRP
jgi:hypothetical protein